MDQGTFTERNDIFFKSLYYNTLGYLPHIDKQNLIPTEETNFEELRETRNLQPKFINLKEQFDSYIDRPKIVQNIMKSTELVTIVVVMFILIIFTWSIMGYIFIYFNNKTSNMSNVSIKSDSSMSTLRPELNYQFNFLPPAIPLKNKHKRASSGTYDVPGDSQGIAETSIDIPEAPIVTYATIKKNQPTSV